MENRREFLKQTGAIGAVALTSSLGFLSHSCKAQENKLGVALVGLGNYSNTMLGPALKETEECYLSGIVTGTPRKAEEWSEDYNIAEKNIYNYDNYDDIANNPDIDIIYVVLPNSMHAEYTIRALEAGKHVICEKPMGMTAEECRQMIYAAEKANRKLAVGYRLHYDPYHQEVMKYSSEKTFGDINILECSLGYHYKPDQDSWKMKKAMGGGPLYNLGVYPIQGARYTKGLEPVFLSAQAYTKDKDHYVEVDEIVTWQLEYSDGSICNSMTTAAGYVDRLYAGCTEGFFELQPSYNYSGQEGRNSNGKIEFEQVFQQRIQIDDFAKCVKEDRKSRISGEEGLRDAMIIDAIHRSIRTGERVKV